MLDSVRVLVIDSDNVFGRQLETFLSRQSASVLLITDGYQVDNACIHFHPDVVFAAIGANGDGLDMLIRLGQGPWACIALVPYGSMDIIRQALRLGASDCIIKTGCEFNSFIDIILSNIQQQPLIEEDCQRAELRQHFEFLRENDIAASQLMAQMLPDSGTLVGNYLYIYQLTGKTILPMVSALDDEHIAVAVIDFGLLGREISIAAVILHSLLQEAWRSYTQDGDSLSIDPEQLVAQLNQMIIDAGLKFPIGMFYGILGQQTVHVVNAGLLNIGEPFNDVGIGLGVLTGAGYSQRILPLEPQGLYLSFSNPTGDRLSLKLLPLMVP
ncbi:hypothetical protein [Celerinatantimonas yamalensis]|uniref:Response regulatory domain-containing protein n=1 Tax=Celerinatantimonas yamalensis TaxID=559956 RepID=A0ABW9G6C9_9GAMM